MAIALAAHITIPALFSNCWVSLPMPSFLRLLVLGVLAVAGAFAECISPILTLYTVYIVYTVYNQSVRGVDAENPTKSGF
jgi:hypothetical protein